MVSNWSMTKDELYGPPPAYSLNPPSSIYIIPEIQERPSSRSSIILSPRFLRYLLIISLIHIVIGLSSIVCDIILITMNESYSFTGVWTGFFNIILGIYLIVFMSHPEKQICSFQRFKCISIIIILITLSALILSSINLSSHSCYKLYLETDQCHYSAYKIKIILVIFYTFTFLQICITAMYSHQIVSSSSDN